MSKITIKEHIKMYWKYFFEKAEKTPETLLPQQQVNLAHLFDGKKINLKVSWLGHSSLLIKIGGYSILADPIFESKVTLMGPTRFNKELQLNVQDLPSVDAIIISHNHCDHLNKFSIQQLSDKTGVFLVPLRVGKRLVQWGVPEKKIVELNWWDEYHPYNNLTIAATPGQHFSSRGLFDKKHGPFDMTFLECGPYNKRWSKIHMFPEQTVQAHLDIKGKILQPIH